MLLSLAALKVSAEFSVSPESQILSSAAPPNTQHSVFPVISLKCLSPKLLHTVDWLTVSWRSRDGWCWVLERRMGFIRAHSCRTDNLRFNIRHSVLENSLAISATGHFHWQTFFLRPLAFSCSAGSLSPGLYTPLPLIHLCPLPKLPPSHFPHLQISGLTFHSQIFLALRNYIACF